MIVCCGRDVMVVCYQLRHFSIKVEVLSLILNYLGFGLIDQMSYVVLLKNGENNCTMKHKRGHQTQ